MFRIISFLFIVLIFSSCSQSKRSDGPTKGGLTIENGINRGATYTDSTGTEYNLRYIPITLTNDSSVSMQVQLAFFRVYHPPAPDGEEKFKLIPLSKEWAMDGVDITDSMMAELPAYINNPVVDKTIKPGETLTLAIGALYAKPTQFTGVLPGALFTLDERMEYPDCIYATRSRRLDKPKSRFGLKLTFGEKCRIVPCGRIYYP